MKRMLIALAVSVLCSVFSVQEACARLGETREECIKRYGQPVSDPKMCSPGMTSFLKDGIVIKIAFWDGKGCRIIFGMASHGQLKDDLIGALLEANAAGSTWIEGERGADVCAENRDVARFWRRADGVAYAQISPYGQNSPLVLWDQAWEDLQKKKTAARKEDGRRRAAEVEADRQRATMPPDVTKKVKEGF